MTEVIYKDNEWLIERQPAGVTDPMVVRFVKGSAARKLLDQNARWTGAGWDEKRWVPEAPKVPKWLLQQVTAHCVIAEMTNG